MKFNISKRPAKLGTNIPFRTEFHGDDAVTAGDIAIKEVMFDDNELCALLQEPLAFRSLFKARPNSTLYDPLLPCLKPLKLADTIDEATLTIFVGVDQASIELGLTRLKGITLSPQPGGMTSVAFTAQCTPTLDKRIGELLDHLDAGIYIELAYAHKGQQQGLSLEGGGKPKFDGSHIPRPAVERNGNFDRSGISEPPPSIVDPDAPGYNTDEAA